MVPMSTHVGVNMSHELGKKSLARLDTMITKRSNHMPTLTTIESTNMIGMLVRSFLNQKSCGVMTLQLTMIKYAHQYWPKARLMKANFSYIAPEYHAMKNSIE